MRGGRVRDWMWVKRLRVRLLAHRTALILLYTPLLLLLARILVSLQTRYHCGLDTTCWWEGMEIQEVRSLSQHYDPIEGGSRKMFVYDQGGVRVLKFGSLKSVRQATAVVRSVLCAFYESDESLLRILVFGMGGGMIPAYLQQQHPSASMDAVDLQADVFDIAFTRFNVAKSPTITAHVADARRWLNDNSASAGRYDVVVQDACGGHPCSLLTVEGLTILRDRYMAEHGVVLQNMFRGQANLLRTYQTVFPSVLLADTGSSSKIIVASRAQLPTRQALLDRSRLLQTLGIGPKCFFDGLGRGRSPAMTLTSLVQSSVTDASEPLLAIEPIFDNNTEVVELEQQRWGKS